jgi:hypothetical protein
LMASAGVLLQAISGWWDVLSHMIQFRDADPPLNPAHIGLYTGVALLLISYLTGLMRRTGWRLPLGIGLGAQIMAGLLNEITHRIPQLEESPLHFTAHAMFTVGLLSNSLTLFISVSLSMLLTNTSGASTRIFQLMNGTALWLTSSGSVIYIFGITFTGMLLLGLTAATILGTTAYTANNNLAATAIWASYTATIYFFTVGYAGATPYIPLGFIPALWIDMTRRHAIKNQFTLLFTMTLAGLLTYLTLPTSGVGLQTHLAGGVGGLLGGALIVYAGRRLSRRYPGL